MPYLVAQGAMMSCSMGVAPAALMLTPRPFAADGLILATVMDHQAMTNIMPFNMCLSMGNPMVAAASAAAGGALTPQPCIPQTPMPWTPGSQYIFQNQSSGARYAALTSDSTCNCIYGGRVWITEPACQVKAE